MDIIFFAIIAIALCYRLYTVLGRDDGSVPQKASSAYKTAPIEKINPRDKLDQSMRRYNVPLFLKSAFSTILLKDPTFDFKDFIQGAQGAYELILSHAFQGDLDTIQDYISPAVKIHLNKLQPLERFRINVLESLIVSAEAEIPKASITVQFKSTVKDTYRMEDWVFTRDLDSNDPTWILTEIITLGSV